MKRAKNKKSDLEIEVTRAHQYANKKTKKETTFFDMKVNGVSIYGCTLVEGKNGTFVSFPSYKGSNDKYYNHARVELSDDDIELIETLVSDALEED